MLVSSRHFLKPEVMSFIEMMLFKDDALICGFLKIQGRMIFVSLLSLSCGGWPRHLEFVGRME